MFLEYNIGVCRIINNSGDSELKRGEILVSRATDPGMTPYFSLISGLVTEVGGFLSHGSVIARFLFFLFLFLS